MNSANITNEYSALCTTSDQSISCTSPLSNSHKHSTPSGTQIYASSTSAIHHLNLPRNATINYTRICLRVHTRRFVSIH